MSNRRLVPLNVVALPSVPVGAARSGDIVYNTTDGNLYVSDGETWTAIGGASGPYGSVSFSEDFALKTTDDLAEGAQNQYFTEQRALDATASSYDPIGASTQAEIAANLYTDQSIADFEALPDQANHAGEYLTTDGTTTSWGPVDALPDQSNNSGRFLTTDGSTASWAEIVTETTQFSVRYYPPENPTVGACYFDRTLSQPVWWNGTSWWYPGAPVTVDGGSATATYLDTLDGGTASTNYSANLATISGGTSAGQ